MFHLYISMLLKKFRVAATCCLQNIVYIRNINKIAISLHHTCPMFMSQNENWPKLSFLFHAPSILGKFGLTKTTTTKTCWKVEKQLRRKSSFSQYKAFAVECFVLFLVTITLTANFWGSLVALTHRRQASDTFNSSQ